MELSVLAYIVLEFRTFIEHTEKELWHLFQGIDRDHNGQIDKEELSTACADAGIIIPQSKLDQFFQTVDTNHDGVISFDEWRCVQVLVNMIIAILICRQIIPIIHAIKNTQSEKRDVLLLIHGNAQCGGRCQRVQ